MKTKLKTSRVEKVRLVFLSAEYVKKIAKTVTAVQ